MLVTKFCDAINDSLIGALVDSHKNKGKGKFKAVRKVKIKK